MTGLNHGRIGAMLAWLLSIGPITPQPALITYPTLLSNLSMSIYYSGSDLYRA